jgi:hypothetical protein
MVSNHGRNNSSGWWAAIAAPQNYKAEAVTG